MHQIGVLHTLRSTDWAGAFVHGFQSEGFAVPWDAEAGGMMAIGAADPRPAACWVVLWTRDAPTSRWVIKYAEEAARRGALVEVLVEKMASPVRNDIAPIDFSDFDCSRPMANKLLWKELMRRIEAKTGQPTGRLPFKKQIEPVAWMGAVGSGVVSIMAIMQPGVQPTSVAVLNSEAPLYAEAQAAAHDAMGGPVVAPENLVTARLEEHVLKPLHIKVTTRFEPVPLPHLRVADVGEAVEPGTEVVRTVTMRDPG
jgi:hypothetical protein